VHKKALLKHANIAYEEKYNKVSLENKCWWMVNGVIVVKKWNHGSEYVVNIVLPPSTKLVACPHAT